MAPRTAHVAAGVAAAAGVAWAVRKLVRARHEAQRCRLQPLTPEAWAAARDADRATVAALVQLGGVAPELRAVVWPLLLALPPAAAREATFAELQRRCAALEEAGADDAFAEACRVIAADVPRTPLAYSEPRSDAEARLTRLLRAYAAHDRGVGYCQGLSEVCAVFVAVFGGADADEPLCFAAFAAFVAQQRRSFMADVSAGVCVRLRTLGALLKRADPAVGAHLAHLGADDCTWALRPMVALLLRELGPEDATTLFDVLMVRNTHVWLRASCTSTHERLQAALEDFLLAVIAAALLGERAALLAAEGMDDLLRLINSLAGTLVLGRLLADARALAQHVSAAGKLA
jgi:hypothetical protein